jgi:hypothetical protein
MLMYDTTDCGVGEPASGEDVWHRLTLPVVLMYDTTDCGGGEPALGEDVWH